MEGSGVRIEKVRKQMKGVRGRIRGSARRGR
jgi:hypothetical protein